MLKREIKIMAKIRKRNKQFQSTDDEQLGNVPKVKAYGKILYIDKFEGDNHIGDE